MKLFTHEYGLKENPVIVFLHGLGVSSWMWHDQIDALKDEFYCIAIDLPGNGESYQTEWISMADSASQVAKIIREKAVGSQAHVVGLSLGGYTAVSLLAHHSEFVLSMIVSGITTGNIVQPWLVKPLTKLTPHLIKFPPLVTLSAKAMMLPDEVIPLYKQDVDRLSKQTIRRIYEEVLHYKIPALPKARMVDLLVAAGDKEAKAVLNGLTYFEETHKETAVVQAPNAHHGWNAEHPDLFSDMIRAWVSKRPLPQPLKVLNKPMQNAIV